MRTTRPLMLTAALVTALGAALAHDAARACDTVQELADRRAKVVAQTDRAPAEVARAHYLLGVWAAEHGLADDARTAFRRAVELAPDHAAARERLGHVRSGDRWLTREDAMAAKGMVRRDGRWVLREEAEILDLPKRQKDRRRADHVKVRELLAAYAAGTERARAFAKNALDAVSDENKVEPLAFALRAPHTGVRELAANELGRIGNRRALRPLLYRAIHDSSEDVRHAALDAAKEIGDENLVTPLVRALGSDDANVRMHAADSIARAGDVRGVKYLVFRFEARGGGAPRAYNMTANQVSFIEDFDVEVASTAFIADPTPSVIQDGTVIDVQVVATQQTTHVVEREVIHGALQRLTGATDVPNEDGAWAAWWKDHGADLTAAR